MAADDARIDHADEDGRKQDIARRLSELTLAPVSSDLDLSRSDAMRLPLGELASLGVGFASMPEAFRTVVQTVGPNSGEQLFRSILPDGATLKQARDGLFSSSAKLADGSPAWGKFQAVSPSAQAVTTTIPYNPAMLAMAISLAQINQKLDGIQKTLDEMFDYLRAKDKANIRASLDTLVSILNDYKYNWDNGQFKQAKYVLVQSINRDARQHIIELRAMLAKKSGKKGFVELRGQADGDAAASLDVLKDYRLAVYLYSFSSFLGVMLLENYDQAYLESKAADIRRKAIDYREAYTACFDAIESRNRESIDSFVLGGLSAGIRGLGKMIEGTPIGDATQIDEALVGAGSGIGGFNKDENRRIARRLTEAKDPATTPFADSLDAVNRIYNQPAQILTDGNTVYLVTEANE